MVWKVSHGNKSRKQTVNKLREKRNNPVKWCRHKSEEQYFKKWWVQWMHLSTRDIPVSLGKRMFTHTSSCMQRNCSTIALQWKLMNLQYLLYIIPFGTFNSITGSPERFWTVPSVWTRDLSERFWTVPSLQTLQNYLERFRTIHLFWRWILRTVLGIAFSFSFRELIAV